MGGTQYEGLKHGVGCALQSIECFAVNPRRGLLAFSPRMPSPVISVVALPQNQERARLSAGGWAATTQTSSRSCRKGRVD